MDDCNYHKSPGNAKQLRRNDTIIDVLQDDENDEVIRPLTLSFGSCFDVAFPYQDIFKAVNADKPDVFVWLGDFAYVSRSKRMNYK